MDIRDEHSAVAPRARHAVGTDNRHIPVALAGRLELLDLRAEDDRFAGFEMIDVALELFQDEHVTGNGRQSRGIG